MRKFFIFSENLCKIHNRQVIFLIKEYSIKTDTLNLLQTLEGGQAFRWSHTAEGIYSGVAGGKLLKLRQDDGGITFLDIEEEDIPRWLDYFDMQTDYAEIINRFSVDETLKLAAGENRGLRILRQEPFETLISFIISQNNNIPRIKGIVSRLCETFGEKCGGWYAFPTAERLAAATEEELLPLRAGFRNRYILDAARKTVEGTVNLQGIYAMTYDEGREELKKIVGVGDKVADCVLLFAYHKTEAFPVDVWIKRVVAEYYPAGLPECMGEYKGIAQQYLFEFFRNQGK